MTINLLDNPQDFVILAGQRSPGLATIEGLTSPRRWDERRGYGLSGATLVFRGIGLAHFKLFLRLITTQHWVDWNAWQPLVQRPPLGERPRAMDLEHPIPNSLDIRSVVVEDVVQPVQTADGQWTIEIHLAEFRRPQIALARPTGSDARSTDRIDQQLDERFDRLHAINQQLAAP